jgi:cell pole-organizing protein PopZ
MEEILASIRRILNEDDVPVKPDTGGSSTDDDVLVLDQSMMVATVEPGPDATEAEPVPPSPEPEHQQEMEAITPTLQDEPPGQPAPNSDLVAPEAAAAAASSVGNLMRSLAAGRATQVYSGGPTLEDIVRAELRPLLKEWLDVNLPPVVERLVRAEIERVVSRAVP